MAAAAAEADQKVVLHVCAVGDAPRLRKTVFKISGSEKFVKATEFLRKQLHRDTLCIFTKPDELVIDLYNNFAIDGKLVLDYALSAVWG